MKKEVKVCVTCLMDTTDPNITFSTLGICNYCQEAELILPNYRYSKEQIEENIAELIKHLKSKKRGKYDSLIGISGGVDSSYVTHLASQWKLNPLVVHFDNGWNSELAVSNINKILDKTGFDFQTYVIDWEEFKDLQRAFLKASVIDIEILTDHAIKASMFRIAKENNIRCILSGTNYATEHGLPSAWVWHKGDLKNIRSIHKIYGTRKLRTFPTMGPYTTIIYKLIYQLDFLEPLNLINYSKSVAMETLKTEYGWRYYGGKHYESVFTKFYQAYILPEKFKVDKRKSHLSALIRNNEISLEEGKDELNKPLYLAQELAEDKEFVLKKLGFSFEEFDRIINEPPKSHDSYPSDLNTYKKISKLRKIFKI